MTKSCTLGISLYYTQGARPDFLTRRVVKCWAPEMISTYIWDHNLGAQPCKSTTQNWQEANDGGHYRKTRICQYLGKYLRKISFKDV